jgi:hypothetical protein
MAQYMVAIHHPDGYDGSLEGPEMADDIDVLNHEMVHAGAWVFAGGLNPVGVKSIRKQADGKPLVSDGPYIEAKEHIGGFWVLECADMDEALEWGRKASVACRAPIEVRAFLPKPD